MIAAMPKPVRLAGFDQLIVDGLGERGRDVEFPTELANVRESERECGLISDAHLSAGRKGKGRRTEKSSGDSACSSAREAGPCTLSIA